MEGFFIVIAILSIIGMIIGVAIYFDKKRREALQALAQRLRFNFYPKDTIGLSGATGKFKLFDRGRSRAITNIMERESEERGIYVALFDYRYVTGSGKNSQTHVQTVVYFRTDKLTVPRFSLSPENIFHKIGEAFGYKDIDFDAYPEFSKNYLLRGDNEDAIRRLFQRDLIRTFEQDSIRWHIEGVNHELIVYRANKRAKVDQIPDLLQHATALFDRFVASTPRKQIEDEFDF